MNIKNADPISFMNRQRYLIVWVACLFLISCGRGSEVPETNVKLQQYVNRLALPGEKGRVSGTPEEADAANYITDQFIRIGLSPVGDEGTYLQQFVLRGAHAEEMGVDNHLSRNVAGMLTGSLHPDRYIVAGARYDGPGGGSGYAMHERSSRRHPYSAEDLASGVAGLLWLAEQYARETPEVSIIFIAFSGNEQGLTGSSYFINHTEIQRDSILAMVNIGEIGQLHENRVTISGKESSNRWNELTSPPGSDTLTAIIPAPVVRSSDYFTFLSAGIPALNYTTSLFDESNSEADAEEPGREGEGDAGLDYGGMTAVLNHIKEVINNISQADPEELSFAGPEHISGQSVMNNSARLGVQPDYTFRGAGLRIEEVTPGSPAERAELESGDIIKAINGTEISDLYAYMEVMRLVRPPAAAEVLFERGGAVHRVEVTF